MSSVVEFNQHARSVVIAPTSTTRSSWPIIDDIVLLGVMPLIAGCGLVYEYALSHYAGVILGNTETAIFIMIGIMIMSAGFGSLMSQRIVNAFTGMVWLEISIIILGSSAVPAIAGTVYFSNHYVLPHLPVMQGSVGIDIIVPYIFGFIMGFLMGMEMPLVARIREHIRGAEGARGTAIVYASDCIGIAAGTFAWAAYLGDIDVTAAASMAASVNALALSIFILRYRAQINFNRRIIAAVMVAFLVLGSISTHGVQWSEATSIEKRG
ncbi:MAG: hypothetical protein OEW08_10360 [Gammaproteobacteria bacterium]|nr:hypothetical protein [Gammaproteobacteria bacterium]